MSGHTPGDWIYGVRRDGSMWLSIGDRRHGPHYQGDLVATEEDARLIAAAPMLLAGSMIALEVAESWIHDQLDGTSSLEVALAELDPVRAAIAAATGENA